MAEKANTLITPRATVTGWVSILKPDTKFNPEGDYKIKVRIPRDAKGLSDLLEVIEEAKASAKAEFQKNPKNKGKRVKDGDLPFYEDEDTNEVVMSFKSKASYADKKTGERRSRTIPIFGASGRIKPDQIPNFGEGSEVRVAFQASGFCNAAVGAGVTLRLESIKLLTVKEFSAGASNPFDDDDEGYSPESSGGDGDPYGDDDGGYQGGSTGSDEYDDQEF